MQRISSQIPDAQAEALDAAIAEGRFASRSAAVRQAIDLLLEPPRADIEVVEAEIVLDAPPLPDRQREALDVARRFALPLLGTGALALATRLVVRRRPQPHPARRLAFYSEEMWRVAVRRG
jgi:Arc/MetJ-type ribon-helix-helix transcriptional regulator